MTIVTTSISIFGLRTINNTTLIRKDTFLLLYGNFCGDRFHSGRECVRWFFFSFTVFRCGVLFFHFSQDALCCASNGKKRTNRNKIATQTLCCLIITTVCVFCVAFVFIRVYILVFFSVFLLVHHGWNNSTWYANARHFASAVNWMCLQTTGHALIWLLRSDCAIFGAVCACACVLASARNRAHSQLLPSSPLMLSSFWTP